MIIFLIISVLIGVLNCLAYKKIERTSPFIHDEETGEPRSIFRWDNPWVFKTFIIFQFVPVINIPIFILLIIDVLTGKLK